MDLVHTSLCSHLPVSFPNQCVPQSFKNIKEVFTSTCHLPNFKLLLLYSIFHLFKWFSSKVFRTFFTAAKTVLSKSAALGNAPAQWSQLLFLLSYPCTCSALSAMVLYHCTHFSIGIWMLFQMSERFSSSLSPVGYR